MFLTLAAIVIDRLWLRRTPEQRLTAAVVRSNRIAAERIAIDKAIAANQAELLRLTQTQGPQLVDAVVEMLNGSIGGRVGLGFQTPNWSGHLKDSTDYR